MTGASRGIGRACAESLASAGARVAVCASSSAPELPGAFSRRCDVSDAAQVKRFFADLERQVGPPDVVVLNAGVLERGPIEEFAEEQWDRVLDVNLKAAFLCAKAAWPALRKTRGRIVAIGSISGTLGTAHAAAYNASKWGLTGFIKSLAEEGREQGIFSAVVLPGSVDTAMLEKTPFEPDLQPGDVARVVRFLADDAPFAMTGSAVEVFG
ncbi:MAG TPA: SDR family oxidoreductase [Myxococcales bacterium]|nr:SDR family oxidoreductase [Myxococcales bacterium]